MSRNDVIVSSTQVVRESGAGLLLSGTAGSQNWWPKSQVRVLSRSFTPAGGKRITFEAPRWLFDAKWGKPQAAESRHTLEGYNVEFQGARPARVAEDY